MSRHAQAGFVTTALDPQLLAIPFEVQTNWHVITGAPSCGKTTLINLLADKGFHIVPEGARQYMESEVARERSLDEIHKDGAGLQRAIKDVQLSIEAGLQADGVVFLDGAVPHSLSWYRIFGLNPNELLPECFHHRYASVFVLDLLPLKLNGYRFKDTAYNDFLDQWLARDFSALGYDVVRVPVLPPEERLMFVLEELSSQGLL